MGLVMRRSFWHQAVQVASFFCCREYIGYNLRVPVINMIDFISICII
jgi:hypothetical protein